MSSVERTVRAREHRVAARQPTGTASLLLGVAAVTLMGCPLLPAVASAWVRVVPAYFVLPTGICAVVSGTGALARMRDQTAADRHRARAGVALGVLAIVVPLVAIGWAFSMLGQA
ncbi:hypothetical protein [Streptomyces buecherae]|uniref:hypothetical protein n=1 Tax=Streptomyces buecherae TaxID=2763006 RepID=UPI0037B2567C